MQPKNDSHQVITACYVINNIYPKTVSTFDRQNKKKIMKKFTVLLLCTLVYSFFSPVNAQPWSRHSEFPEGAKILDIESDNAGNIFVLTREGEIYHSDNAGQQWDAIPGVFSFYNTLDIEVDEVTGILFVGTTGSGITWTDDLGQTWSTEYIYTNPVSGFHATFYKVGVKHGANIVVGSEPSFTNSPIYTTVNGGATWATQPLAPFAGALDFLFLPTGDLLAACEMGVFTSPNNGASWSALNNGISTMQTRSIALNTTNGFLYAATDINVATGDTTGIGIYLSVNNGATWSLASNGIADRRITEVLVDKLSGDVYALSPDGVYRSTNNGTSWQLVNINLLYKNFNAADQLPSGEIVIGSEKDGVAFSSQPVSGWAYRNTGLAKKDFSSMIVNQNHIFLLGEETGTIFRKNINDTTWQQPANMQLPQLGLSSFLRNDSAGNLYAIFDGWNTTVDVMRSSDNGDTWSSITASIPLPSGATSIQFLDFKAAPGGILYLIANYKGLVSTQMDLFKSTDGGVTWNSVLQVPSGNLISMSEMDIAPNGNIYVAAFTNSFTHTVMLSSNQGLNFSTFSIPPVTFGSFYDIIIDNNNNVLFSFNNVLQKRVGVSWVPLTNGGWSTTFNQHPIRLYIDDLNNYYVTCIDDGVYFSSNSGSSWTNITSGIPQYNTPFGNIRLTLLNFDFDSLNNPYAMSNDDDVEAASIRGVYTRNLITGLGENNTASLKYIHFYPNPSNGIVYLNSIIETKLGFEIAIADLQGRIIRTLNYASLPITIEIDLRDLMPGYYLVNVTSADRQSIFKWMKN